MKQTQRSTHTEQNKSVHPHVRTLQHEFGHGDTRKDEAGNDTQHHQCKHPGGVEGDAQRDEEGTVVLDCHAKLWTRRGVHERGVSGQACGKCANRVFLVADERGRGEEAKRD